MTTLVIARPNVIYGMKIKIGLAIPQIPKLPKLMLWLDRHGLNIRKERRYHVLRLLINLGDLNIINELFSKNLILPKKRPHPSRHLRRPDPPHPLAAKPETP